MSTIPLPALDIKPVAIADPMEAYGKMMSLKTMQQQQQLQGQQMQEGAADLQLKQQGLKDQQAMTSSMQNWDGKDINALVPMVIKNGGSSTAVMGLKSKILEQQEKYSTIAEKDSKTGETNLTTMKGKNDYVLGGMNTVLGAPDNELAQRLTATTQDLVQRGMMDPEHAKIVGQMAQLGDPAQIRSQLGIFAKGYMSQSQLMKQATDDADLAAKNAGLPKTQAESQQAQQALIAQNLGGAKSQLEWTAKRQFLAAKGIDVSQVPEQFSLEAAASAKAMGISPEKMASLPDVNTYIGNWLAERSLPNTPANWAKAHQAFTTETKTQPGMARMEVLMQMPQAVADPNHPGGVVYTTRRGSIGQSAPQGIDTQIPLALGREMTSGTDSHTITAGNTLTHHLDLYDHAVDAVHNGNVKALNKIANELGIQMGSNAQTNLSLIRQGVAMEAARYYTGGVPGEAEITQFNNSLTGDGSPGQMHGGAATVRAMAKGKLQGLQGQYQSGMQGQPNFGQQPQAQPQQGGGQQLLITVKDPRGIVHTFNNQPAANAFKKAAGIQ